MNQESILSLDEFLSFSRKLRDYHPLFMELWTLGDVYANPKIENSRIQRDDNGASLRIEVNPDYWDSLEEEQKLTLISHNCLHEYLNHPKREAKLEKKEIASLAADLTVNQLLKDNFKFRREDFPEECIFAEDVFPDEYEVRSLEYYYEKLLEENQETPQSSCDSHSPPGYQEEGEGEPQEGDEDPQEGKSNIDLKDILPENVTENLPKSEEFKISSSYGNQDSTSKKTITIPVVQPNKKWNIFLKKKFYKTKHGIEEYVKRMQWIRPPRRMSCLDSQDIILPSEGRILDYLPKTKVKIFLDVSGSCSSISAIFAKAAAQVPRRYFDCKFYTFDTRVRPLEIPRSGKEIRLPNGGGTNFRSIVDQVESEKLPDIIFVLTDGDAYKPTISQKPEIWHWFLIKVYWMSTEKQYLKSNIPEKCNIHHFEEFTL